jgi:hypothetical protein
MPRTKREGDKYEDDLHVRVAKYLDHVKPDDCVWWHTPNGARYDPAKAASTAALLAMMGLRPGMPDILLIYRGKLFGCELKSVTGTATEDQISVAVDLNMAGACIADPLDSPVRTIEEMEALLLEWEIPLKFSYSDLKTKNIMKPHEAKAMTAIAQADKGLKARRAARFRKKTSVR